MNRQGTTSVADANFQNEMNHSDEIDLFDLWDDIMSNKRWLIAGVVACFSLAVLYLFLAKPVYSVNSVVKPVSERHLVQLNVPQLKDIYALDVAAAFTHAKSALLSTEYRRNFYQAQLETIKSIDGLYNSERTEAQNFAGFNKLLSTKLSNDKKDKEQFINLTFELTDATLAADLLNQYVGFSLASRLAEIRQTLESKMAVRLNELDYDASVLRNKYYSNKTQRKLKLDEATQIATAVGQVEPVYTKSDILGSFKPPLYMYGIKALKAEEKALAQRDKLAKALPNGEEHFIAGLSNILFEVEQLKKLKIDYDSIQIAQVDEPALIPLRAAKPKKLLILVLALVAGGFMGLMMSLLMAAYKRHIVRV